MTAPVTLLASIARAAAENLATLLHSGVNDDFLLCAWRLFHSHAPDEAARRREIEALASVDEQQLREAAWPLAQRFASGRSLDDQRRLMSFLMQVPAAIRRRLTSRTTTRGPLVLDSHYALRAIMPPAAPHYQPGEHPLPNVDLELVELLGVGGFGEVWKARNHRLPNRPPVALKFCFEPRLRQRLLSHEAEIIDRALQHGRHPGLVTLLHSYLSADPPCLEYEYVGDGDLADLVMQMHAEGTATPEALARLVADLARTVGFAHQHGLVHRDLKPSNILVRQQPGAAPKCLIADFGISAFVGSEREAAKLDTSLEKAQTLFYSSPQQAAGCKPAATDDIFSLGVLWYQLQVGDFGMPAPTGNTWRAALLGRGLSPALLQVMTSCFEARAEDRPANGAVLAERIETALATLWQEEEIWAGPPPAKPKKKGLLVPVAACLALAVCFVAAGVMLAPSLLSGHRQRSVEIAESDFAEKESARSEIRIGEATYLSKDIEPRKIVLGGGHLSIKEDGSGTTNSIGMRFVRIPKGVFTIGSPEKEQDRENHEGPQRQVVIPQPFWMGTYEVMQAEYAEIMGSNPSHFSPTGGGAEKVKAMDTDRFPVERVTYEEATEFCEKLSARPDEVKARRKYRLPTEVEWEYACRAGTKTAFHTGDVASQKEANLAETREGALRRTTETGQYRPNAWGLYDMHGNVAEWCRDWYGATAYRKKPVLNPDGPASGVDRVIRGGAWSRSANDCRSAARDFGKEDSRFSGLGFRVVIEPAP